MKDKIKTILICLILVSTAFFNSIVVVYADTATVTNVSLKSQTNNIFDEEYETGFVINSTGTITANSNYSISKNYIPVEKTTNYFSVSHTIFRISFYDSDFNFISIYREGTNDYNFFSFSTNTVVSYIRICFYKSYLYDNMITSNRDAMYDYEKYIPVVEETTQPTVENTTDNPQIVNYQSNNLNIFLLLLIVVLLFFLILRRK